MNGRGAKRPTMAARAAEEGLEEVPAIRQLLKKGNGDGGVSGRGSVLKKSSARRSS